MFEYGFPNNLNDDVLKVIKFIPNKTYSNIKIGISDDRIHYLQDGHLIEFPYRIYFIEVTNEVLCKLNLQQKMILHCIYTRSCNGYIRQKHLQSLLQMDYENWVIPYIVKLCDEYVVEILEMTYEILKNQDTERIKLFCNENLQSFAKSYDRMVSYWNEFYRYEYNHFNKYIGRELFRECFGYSNSIRRRL